MRIIGIDPGFAIVGFSVLELRGSEIIVLDYGSIQTHQSDTFESRLSQVRSDLGHIIKRFQPEELSIEKLFFSKNVTTALRVAEARGVLIEVAHSSGLLIQEYSPQEVKIALTSTGSASKEEVQDMAARIFNLPERPKPDDVADALAVGYCHAVSRNILI